MALLTLNKTLDDATLTGGAEVVAAGGGLPRRITTWRRTYVTETTGGTGPKNYNGLYLTPLKVVWHPTLVKMFIAWNKSTGVKLQRIDVATLTLEDENVSSSYLNSPINIGVLNGKIFFGNYGTSSAWGGILLFDPDDLSSYDHIAVPEDYCATVGLLADGNFFFGNRVSGNYHKFDKDTLVADPGNPFTGPVSDYGAALAIPSPDGDVTIITGSGLGTPAAGFDLDLTGITNLYDDPPAYSHGKNTDVGGVGYSDISVAEGFLWVSHMPNRVQTMQYGFTDRITMVGKTATKVVRLGPIPAYTASGSLIHPHWSGVVVSPEYAGGDRYSAWAVCDRNGEVGVSTNFVSQDIEWDIRRKTLQRTSWSWTFDAETYPEAVDVQSINVPGYTPWDHEQFFARGDDVTDADVDDLIAARGYYSIDGGTRTQFTPGEPMSVSVPLGGTITLDIDMYDWTPVGEQTWIAGSVGEGPTLVADDPAATIYTDRWLNSQKSTVGSTNTPNGRARIIL